MAGKKADENGTPDTEPIDAHAQEEIDANLLQVNVDQLMEVAEATDTQIAVISPELIRINGTRLSAASLLLATLELMLVEMAGELENPDTLDGIYDIEGIGVEEVDEDETLWIAEDDDLFDDVDVEGGCGDEEEEGEEEEDEEG